MAAGDVGERCDEVWLDSSRRGDERLELYRCLLVVMG